MKRAFIAAVAFTLLLAACGDDDTDATADALSAVCDARDSVAERLADLDALSPTENTAGDYREAVDALQTSIDDLREARSELVEQDVANLESAFDQLKSDLSELGDITLADAGDAVSGAIEAGATALTELYGAALEGSSCG